MKNKELYLYRKMKEKIDEILSTQKKIDIHTLAQTLPNKVRLTRLDVYKVLKEMDKNKMLKLKEVKNLD